MRRLAVVLAVVVGWVVLGAGMASAAVWTGTTPAPFWPDLRGVGASSATDVWAVGENDADYSTPVAEHWNGTAWTGAGWSGMVPDGGQGGLLGVAAISPGDAWAVGWQDGAGGALAVHWDGTAWSAVGTPAAVGGGRRGLASVSALGAADVWAVGAQSSGALVEHWNGTRWGVVTAPRGAGALTSVQAVGARNVWAVGGRVVAHYNGTKWAVVAAPVTAGTELAQVTRVPGTAHLWAVGTSAAGRPVALLYNGTRWVAHNPPGAGELDGVAALGAGDVWASGTSLTGDPRNVTFHWTGTAWHPVTAAGLANSWVENMARAPGSTELWAVGMNLTTDGPFAAYRP